MTDPEAENVTICITPKYSTTPEASPSSPTEIYDLWESIMLSPPAESILKQHTVKSLVHFAHYYGLVCPKGKTNKDILIEMISTFETNPANEAIVRRRQTMWQSLLDLRGDSYFSKFVLSNLLA